MFSRRTALAASCAVSAVLVLAACGSGDSSGATSSSSSAANHTVSVVASTNVWGDVVKQVAGDLAGSRVDITSIISNPDADPHSYEANTQNQLALSTAKLVVENGGGYDDFVHTMLSSAKNTSATVLDAVDISGKKAPAGGELNEHVWYDFPTVRKVAARIATALSTADPADASTYAKNVTAFDARLAAMQATEASIRKAHSGDAVAITEPVPLYLLQACGLVNRTPEEFSEAIENGTDVSAAVLHETLDLFSSKKVDLLAYNEQTSGPQTEAVLKAAKANGIPVVPVTETLPSGKDYLTWMEGNLSAVGKALG